ncbi:MAG TPA: DNA recombination protein RmuC [Candidatus Dormibacteraeota bacterium]|nr:DNA recombination protein RmuC [Candidatus Dormibacteraeota bacterium]
MNLSAMFLVAGAALFGLLLGYLLASLRFRGVETGRASIEGSAAELRSQVENLRSSLQDLQSRLEREKELRATAETSLQKSEENLGEQRKSLDQAKAEMKDVFRALASEALSATTQQFIELSQAHLEGELEPRKIAIEGLVHPLAERLKDLESHLSQLESARQLAYGELLNQVRQLSDVGRDLRQETGTLTSALRQPRVRGAWGELTLRRAVELAGMSPHCDFEEQGTLTGEDGRLRPDLIVHMPGGRDIVVDAKVPLSAFLKASEADTDTERQEAMRSHARLVREHIQGLGSKAYWSQFKNAPELVILFMPGESFFSAALECDRTLIEDALERRVLLSSPTTLIAILRSIAYGWRQHQMEENAARISALGKELYDRIGKFVEHIAGVRDGLERAAAAYNRSVGSFNDRLLPSVRRLGELGVSADAELPALDPTEVDLRSAPDSDGASDASKN